MVQHKQAFTLIELLVVVLIIGVLAAVALPQYKIAVAKSRLASIMSLGKAIDSAKEAYFLANGEYTTDVRKLDIDVPADCTMVDTNGHYYTCGKYWLLDNNTADFVIDYCPDNNQTYAKCQSIRDFQLAWIQQHNTDDQWLPGTTYCIRFNNSALGKSICQNLTGFDYASR